MRNVKKKTIIGINNIDINSSKKKSKKNDIKNTIYYDIIMKNKGIVFIIFLMFLQFTINAIVVYLTVFNLI